VAPLSTVHIRTLPVALLVAWSCLACNAASPDPKADDLQAAEPSPAADGKLAVADFDWDGVSTRPHRDQPSALRFAVPVTGYRLTSTEFDRSTPPIKLKHELLIEQDRREVVRMDVWYDAEQLGLAAWFDKYLRFMATPDAIVERTRAGRGGVDAILILQPRSPQARSQRAAVLALEDKIVRVTSIDDEDPQGRAVFDRVLADLEAEAKQ
jgi:hypothetical protein